MMPVLDGFGLLRELRGSPATERLPVILVSARAGEEAKVEGLEARADDYVIKPFVARELLARVSAALHLARVRAEAGAALRDSEERYRSLTDATAQIVWTTDGAGRWTMPSATYERFTGLAWDHYRDGSMRAIHPGDLVSLRAEWAAILQRGEPGELHFRLRRADGEYRRVVSRGVPLRDGAGNVKEWVGTIMDVEDRLRTEERLRQAADRMAGMTHQLLAFSRQQVWCRRCSTSTRPSPTASRCCSGSSAEHSDGGAARAGGALGPSGPRAAAPGADEPRHQRARCDARRRRADGADRDPRLRARGGRHRGPVRRARRVRLGRGHLVRRPPPHLRALLHDQGDGRRHGARARDGARDHLPEPRACVGRERAGEGTTFTVLLPLAQEPGQRDAAERSGVDDAVRPATVLVVDDEDIIRSLMKRTLEGAGYAVLLARNGREALDSLARHRGSVDLVLSDLVMPVIGGRELAERLAAEHPDLPVVWMSGHPRDMMPASGNGRERAPFLQKPLSPEGLVETVGRAGAARRRPHTVFADVLVARGMTSSKLRRTSARQDPAQAEAVRAAPQGAGAVV